MAAKGFTIPASGLFKPLKPRVFHTQRSHLSYSGRMISTWNNFGSEVGNPVAEVLITKLPGLSRRFIS